MPVAVKKLRLVNPPRKAAKKRKRKNPAPLFVLGAANPRKRKSATMKNGKKSSRRRKNPNPFLFGKRKAAGRKTRRRRNPTIAGALHEPIDLLKFGLIALLGLVTTRQVPQMVLNAENTSWMGYGANLLTAIAGAYGTTAVAGKSSGIAFGTGGGLYLVNRILTDKLTPVGKVLSLQGIGDPHASNSLGRLLTSAAAQGHVIEMRPDGAGYRATALGGVPQPAAALNRGARLAS